MDQKTDGAHTSQQILDIAQGLVQRVGFNAFSYADIAGVLRITKASLHYHFPSKASLGVSLIERYGREFEALLAGIDLVGGGAREKLRRYTAAHAEVLADDRMCLCGMLADEFESVPKEMQTTLDAYFAMNERWLAGVLEEGRSSGKLGFSGPPIEAARYVIDSLEGAMMMARFDGGPARFEAAARRLLASFAP